MADPDYMQEFTLPDPNVLNGHWGQSKETYDADIARAREQARMSWDQAEQDRLLSFGARQDQRAQMDRLQGLASGTAPSLAGAQFDQFQQQNAAAGQSLASAARGGNYGAQRANAERAAAFAGVQGVNTRAQLVQQEQMAAEAALQKAAASARGADQGLRQQDNTREGVYYNGENAIKKAQGQAYGSLYSADRAVRPQPGMFDKALQVGAAAAPIIAYGAASSDEKMKTGIKPGHKATSSLLDSLSAKTFRYRDTGAAGAAKGSQLGIIAQDLERTPEGASLVHDTPSGKMVDTSHAALTSLAAVADVHARLKALEDDKRKDPGHAVLKRAR